MSRRAARRMRPGAIETTLRAVAGVKFGTRDAEMPGHVGHLPALPQLHALVERTQAMSVTVGIQELRVGMFVHLDLGWWAHPFALSSFLVTTPEQLTTIRGLGLKKLRWSPEKSRLDDPLADGAAVVDHGRA